LNIDWQLRLEYKPKLISRGRELGHFCDRHPQSSSGPFDWSLHWALGV